MVGGKTEVSSWSSIGDLFDDKWELPPATWISIISNNLFIVQILLFTLDICKWTILFVKFITSPSKKNWKKLDIFENDPKDNMVQYFLL